jgi:hypothetical protein
MFTFYRTSSKRQLLLLLFIALCAVLCYNTGNAQSGNYYYHDGKRIPVQINKKRLTLTVTENFIPESLNGKGFSLLFLKTMS